jgi:hypothetical protein
MIHAEWKRSILFAFALFGGAPFSLPTFATEIGCAVVLKTPDGFVNLREGPGTQYKVIAKLYPGDFIYVGTELCDAGRCTDERHSWGHVVEIPRLKNLGANIGWVNSSFIQLADCPEFYQHTGQ